jgi:hypothetical protein
LLVADLLASYGAIGITRHPLQPYLIEGFLEPRGSYWRWSVTADPMKQKKSAGAH